MTEQARWDNSEWPIWLHCSWNLEPKDEGCLYCVDGGDELFIQTLEGVMVVKWDDWIIMGARREIYPCKPDIFEAAYEPIEEDEECTEANI